MGHAQSPHEMSRLNEGELVEVMNILTPCPVSFMCSIAGEGSVKPCSQSQSSANPALHGGG